MSKKQSGRLIIITPDGDRTVTPMAKEPTLEQWQKAVGGYIERVRVRVEGSEFDGFVNEEGLGTLPHNRHATALLVPPFDPNYFGNQLYGNLAVWIPDQKKER